MTAMIGSTASGSAAVTAAADSNTRIEFGDKDLLLSSLLWAIQQSIGTTQTPLPPFLVPDHFKSCVKYSIKGSSSSSFLPSMLFPIADETLVSILSDQVPCNVSPIVSGIATFPVAVPASQRRCTSESSPPPVMIDSKTTTSEVTVKSCVPVPMSLPSWIKVKEYAPIVFACLRDKVFPFPSRKFFSSSLIDVIGGPPGHASFLHCCMTSSSLSQRDNYNSNSNNVIYTTADQQILIKSIEGNDVEGLLSLMKSLHPYLVQRKSSGSLLPQYLAVFRISHHAHSVSSAAAAAAHHRHVHAAAAAGIHAAAAGGHTMDDTIMSGTPAAMTGTTTTSAVSSVTTGIGSLLAQTGASVLASASGGGVSGKGSSSESSSYLLLMRNPISCNSAFFPIHDLFILSADGIIAHRVRTSSRTSSSSATTRKERDRDFVLNLKKADADRMISNLESDLKFLSTHLLTGYTISVGIHSIDEWEQELMEEQDDNTEGEDEEGEEGSDQDTGDQGNSISDQLAGLAVTRSDSKSDKKDERRRRRSSSRGRRGVQETLNTTATDQQEEESVVIDPIRHPFAVPSPCVGVESRASSRPSLHSSDTQDSGLAHGGVTVSNSTGLGGGGGRFVYFVGVNDLLPLSASFSSKEQDLEKKHNKKAHKQQQELKSSSAEGGGDVKGGSDEKDKQAAGKKESAREYSRNLMQQFNRRITTVSEGQNSWSNLSVHAAAHGTGARE